jgi:endonuclease/exonuclease/phosphatase family metal-dependent hydrolase
MTQFGFGSYNLRNGGLDNGSDKRLLRQLAMLADLDADCWAFQECKGWRGEYQDYRVFHLAERVLRLRGFLVPSAHHGCDLALFVREPASLQVVRERHERGTQYWHAVARLEVEADEIPGPLYLVSAHLAPSSPVIRLAEAEAFALLAKDGPVIAGGDWNAVPAADPDPPADGADPGHARRKLDRAAARAIEEAGFTDVAAHLGNPAPTVGHTGPDKLAYRCDRIYTTLRAEAITGYQVVTEDDPASDHRPVIAAFRLTGQDSLEDS